VTGERLKIFKISIFLFICLLILFCTSKKVFTSKIVSKDGLDILYGEVSKEQLFFDFPEWEIIYNTYKVNHEILDSISIKKKHLYEVEIFLGTWCGDSEREVPRFLKILDEKSLVLENKVRLFAVDRKKKLENGLAEQNKINYVATFIIKKDSIEIGRIVESPENSLEKDLLSILANN